MPGYVVNDHLSRTAVASSLKQPTWSRRAAVCFCLVLLRMGFTCALSVTRKAVVSYTALPPLPHKRRYISVALSLESPLPDVIRHPALWSPDFPHLRSFDTCSRDHLSYSYLLYLQQKSFLPYFLTLPWYQTNLKKASIWTDKSIYLTFYSLFIKICITLS